VQSINLSFTGIAGFLLVRTLVHMQSINLSFTGIAGFLLVRTLLHVPFVNVDLINLVTVRRTRLVPGWVTIFERVNHLGPEPGNQVDSA